MEIQFDCYSCIAKQVTEWSGKAGKDELDRRNLFKRMMAHLLQVDEKTTPPELADFFYRLFADRIGVSDPFVRIKDLSTELGLKLLPEMREAVKASDDPFLTAVKIAIGGNVIDFGATPDFRLEDAEEAIREVRELPVDAAAVAELRKRIGGAEKILYILDNCGEAVLDRLLLEPMRDKVTVGVRGRPIINDVTRREALMSGLDFAPLVDTGHGAPGVSLRMASPEFKAAMENADLVIAKGQGNFESLEGSFTSRPIFYLLRAKCPVVCRKLNAARGSLQVLGRNLLLS